MTEEKIKLAESYVTAMMFSKLGANFEITYNRIHFGDDIDVVNFNYEVKRDDLMIEVKASIFFTFGYGYVSFNTMDHSDCELFENGTHYRMTIEGFNKLINKPKIQKFLESQEVKAW